MYCIKCISNIYLQLKHYLYCRDLEWCSWRISGVCNSWLRFSLVTVGVAKNSKPRTSDCIPRTWSYASVLKKVHDIAISPSGTHIASIRKAERLSYIGKANRFHRIYGKTWIRNSVWNVESWCVFNLSVRTNNDVEGWHRRLNYRANKANLPLYTLINLLYKEAELVVLSQMQGKLFSFW